MDGSGLRLKCARNRVRYGCAATALAALVASWGACIARDGGLGTSPADDPATISRDDAQTQPPDDIPKFYVVLHADPEIGPLLLERWSRLESFMGDLEERNTNLTEPHRVTVMFSPNWSRLIADHQEQVARWVGQGHEMAFHSHTHNHHFPDGFTNAVAFGPDPGASKCDRNVAPTCSLDEGVDAVKGALDRATGVDYDLQFGTIGPRSNDGPSTDPKAMNHCGDDPQPDDDACIDAEWTGRVNAVVRYHATDYPGVTEDQTDQPSKLLGSSFCRRHGEAQEDIYSVPIAPFETESGRLQVSLTTTKEALELADGGSFIGIAIHPLSYVDAPTQSFDGNGRAQIDALFEHAEKLGLHSRTLREVRAADTTGEGVRCKDAR